MSIRLCCFREADLRTFTTCECTEAMAQTSLPNSSRLFLLQAADFLAIEGHVTATCRVLAARLFAQEALFAEEPKRHSWRTAVDPTQVLFHKHATRSVFWLVILCRDEQFLSAFNMF
jgi:hypothetical protein